jgi:hypothetical protein
LSKNDKICLVSCSVLKSELQKLVKEGKLDVDLVFVSKSFHVDYALVEQNLRKVLEHSLKRYPGRVVVFYGDLCMGQDNEMKRLIYYFLGLFNDISDNLSPRLPRPTEVLALLVLFTMFLVLIADQYLTRYISEKIIRDVGVYIIFTLTGIMGITIIITKEMPIFLIKIRGIPVIIFRVLFTIGSFWLLIGGLISDIQKILQH